MKICSKFGVHKIPPPREEWRDSSPLEIQQLDMYEMVFSSMSPTWCFKFNSLEKCLILNELVKSASKNAYYQVDVIHYMMFYIFYCIHMYM